MDQGPPGSSVHGIIQAGILEWVAMPSSRGSSQPRDWTESLTSPALAARFSIASAAWGVPQIKQFADFKETFSEIDEQKHFRVLFTSHLDFAVLFPGFPPTIILMQ